MREKYLALERAKAEREAELAQAHAADVHHAAGGRQSKVKGGRDSKLKGGKKKK